LHKITSKMIRLDILVSDITGKKKSYVMPLLHL